ncbi:2-C-methyl-D-erythritol 4-phosphate cytidylyltransferase [Marmoricola bigeumensis]|uniref:2-C-methyl-D-erythritol 4-phosphate cytidylyltransferase n=1 Tax=Nocardioides marmoribigeumensis TaxID=433649 RepID=A0ABU2BTJ7_9ACTN|nr:2-C-methyl-D-erythritol 4-phosphate cytidylyltransferase [Nocardioides marmoribigeumensis]
MSSWTGTVVSWAGLVGTAWQGRLSRLPGELGIGEGQAGPDDGLVLLDERCPGLTADDVRRVVASAVGAVAVGVRPVTDTVTTLEDGYVGPGVDRDGLVAVCSPVVVPASLRDRVPADDDLPGLVARLLDSGVPVVLVEVPVAARRLVDAAEVALLDQ